MVRFHEQFLDDCVELSENGLARIQLRFLLIKLEVRGVDRAQKSCGAPKVDLIVKRLRNLK